MRPPTTRGGIVPTHRSFIVLVTVIAALALAAPAALAAPPDQADAVQPFASDVFVIVGGTLRNPTGETPADAPLFNVAGVALDVTWGQFRSATATARAHQTGGPRPRTDVRLDLAGLIPRGVYSVFYATFTPDSRNPLCPNAERTLPLVESFVASPDGTASLRASAEGALLDPVVLLYTVVYHADGMTYGSLPNRGEFVTQGPDCRSSFGADAHRQLIVTQKQT
jgi:hypothetical protein